MSYADLVFATHQIATHPKLGYRADVGSIMGILRSPWNIAAQTPALSPSLVALLVLPASPERNDGRPAGNFIKFTPNLHD